MLLVALLPSNMLEHPGGRTAKILVRAATLRQKLQFKLAISLSHSILTQGQPLPGADPITPSAWQGSQLSTNFEVISMTRPRKKKKKKRKKTTVKAGIEQRGIIPMVKRVLNNGDKRKNTGKSGIEQRGENPHEEIGYRTTGGKSPRGNRVSNNGGKIPTRKSGIEQRGGNPHEEIGYRTIGGKSHGESGYRTTGGKSHGESGYQTTVEGGGGQPPRGKRVSNNGGGGGNPMGKSGIEQRR